MQSDKKAQNKMRDIRVAKLVLNICVGESGDRLQKAAKVSNAAAAFGYHGLLRCLEEMSRLYTVNSGASGLGMS